MNISLTPTLEKYILDKVKTGRYLTASEVVREALRLMEDREHARQTQLNNLKKEVQAGLDQLNRGEYQEFDEAELSKFVSAPAVGLAKRGKRHGKKISAVD